MGEARKHHYVPASYLRGFASTSGKTAQLYVVDLARGKALPRTSVLNVAAKRDFNRIETEGNDPNVLERAYAAFESEAASAIRRIAERRTFDEEEDRILVLNLIALLAVRSPLRRSLFHGFIDRTYRLIAEATFSSEERWKGLRRRMEADGYLPPNNVPFEQLREFVLKGEWDVHVPNNMHAHMELQMIDVVLRTLVDRRWELIEAAPSAGDFVTTDHPVSLVPLKAGLDRMPVGHGMTSVALMFPLTRRLLLWGTFEGTEQRRIANAFEVATLNSSVIAGARPQVYARDATFGYFTRPLAIKTGADLPADAQFRRSDDGLEDIG